MFKIISNLNRAWWFGASETDKILAKNRLTKTWQNWWQMKCNLPHKPTPKTREMELGTFYEHQILKRLIPDMNLDRQFLIPKYRLRVNLDGDYDGVIYECKCHFSKTKDFNPQVHYNQLQLQMWAYEYCRTHFETDLPRLKKGYILWVEMDKDNPPPIITRKMINKQKYNYNRHVGESLIKAIGDNEHGLLRRLFNEER